MAGPAYRGLRLDGPLAELHRAVDRLRWDTDHRHTDQPAHPEHPRRGSRPDPDQAQPTLDQPA